MSDSRPHAPWFPLWIAVGKVFFATGLDPSLALRVPALLLSIWIFIPLRAFWFRFLPKADASAVALLFVATPAAWWFSGRAFSGVGGTAMLVTGLACWFARAEPSRIMLGFGSVAGAAAVLIRPHLLIPVAAVLLVGLRRRTPGERWAMLAPGVVLCAIGVGGLVFASGGFAPLAAALGEHAGYHFGRLPEADWSFTSSGLARSLGNPMAAVAWIGLSGVGAVRLVRTRADRTGLAVLWAVLGGLLILIYGLSNPNHARYFLPFLAVTAGLVIAAATPVGRWAGLVLTLVAAIAWSAWLIPSLARYRATDSPPVRAIRHALAEASRTGAVVVVDATLDAFVKREQALARPAAPIILWPLIERGAVAAPPPQFTITVTDRASRYRPISAGSARTFGSDLRPAAVLGQDRYLHLDISTGARLPETGGPRGPLVVVD